MVQRLRGTALHLVLSDAHPAFFDTREFCLLGWTEIGSGKQNATDIPNDQAAESVAVDTPGPDQRVIPVFERRFRRADTGEDGIELVNPRRLLSLVRLAMLKNLTVAGHMPDQLLDHLHLARPKLLEDQGRYRRQGPRV